MHKNTCFVTSKAEFLRSLMFLHALNKRERLPASVGTSATTEVPFTVFNLNYKFFSWLETDIWRRPPEVIIFEQNSDRTEKKNLNTKLFFSGLNNQTILIRRIESSCFALVGNVLIAEKGTDSKFCEFVTERR